MKHSLLTFAMACVAALSSPSLRAAEPFLEKLDLFSVAGSGYNVYHIPGIVVTAKGHRARVVRGPAEGWRLGAISISSSAARPTTAKPGASRRSSPKSPGPKTKNPFALAIKNVNPADVTYNNPVLIADRDGTVHMLFCLEYMRCFYTRSTDDGVTWSAPVEITATFEKFRPAYDWKVLATGPNHGIQLRTGRLIVPVWLSTGTGGNAHRPSASPRPIYSDDAGKTWQAGEIAVPYTEEWINPNETVAIELADGRVMLNVRNESKAHRRLVTTSKDGATGWSTPKFDDAICSSRSAWAASSATPSRRTAAKIASSSPTPTTSTRADGKEEPGKNRDRKNVSVKLSYDEGKTWPVTKPVEPGYSAYSDLAVTKSGTILCFYGRGAKLGFAGERLTVARCNLEWLTDGKDQSK